MYHFSLALLVSCFSLSLLAQPFNWQWSEYATATTGMPDPHASATDEQGNTYVTGTIHGTATFGTLTPITSAGDADVFVAKYDHNGVALWAVNAGGTGEDRANGLSLDGIGGVYITGSFKSPEAIFGDTSLAVLGLMDIFVARLDAATGDILWAQRYGGNDFLGNTHTERGLAVACDTDGNAYVTGCFKYIMEIPGLPELASCSQYYTSFILKLAPDGTPLWARRTDCGRQWSYSAGEGQAIIVGHDDMLYAGFRVRGDTLFVEADTMLNVHAGGQTHDGVVVKYDLNGHPQWVRQIGGSGYDNVRALQADAEGHLYVGLRRESGNSHLGLPGISWDGNQGFYKNVVLKMDASGNFLKGVRMGNSTSEPVQATPTHFQR